MKTSDWYEGKVTMYGIFGAILLLLATINNAGAVEIGFDDSLASHIEKLVPLYSKVEDLSKTDEVKKTEDDSVQITKVIRISGEIRKGDSNKIIDFSERNTVWRGENSPWYAIVLSGPGGNFSEAHKIGKYIHENPKIDDPLSISGVYVLNNTFCYSSCAIIAAWTSASIENGAKLGFHLPFIPKKRLAEINQPADQLLNVAYDISYAYNELIINKLVTPGLIRKIYEHRTADSMHILTTGYSYHRNGFTAMGKDSGSKLASNTGIDLNTIVNLCQHRYNSVHRSNITDTLFDNDRSRIRVEFIVDGSHDSNITTLNKNDSNWIALDSFHSYASCLIGLENKTLNIILVPAENTSCLEITGVGNGGENRCTIRDPGLRWPVTNYELARYLGCDQDELIQNRFRDFEGTQTITTAKNALNIRSDANTYSPIIAKLSGGAPVNILKCKNTDDSQAVWYFIRSDAGTGWVSARYISGQFASDTSEF